MTTDPTPSACCLIGAGYSVVADLPLTKDLFTTSVVAMSDSAEQRFRAVWDDYARWHNTNPAKNPEEYLANLDGNLLHRPGPPFAWAVELVAATLATPRSGDAKARNPRYGVRVTQPPRCATHVDFWATVARLFDSVAAVTTNYDLLIERALRHRPMRRGFGPGFHYGGIGRPQVLRGAALPFTVTDPQRLVELTGPIPVYKLHGSLSWARRGDGLDLYQDMRPAFRYGGDAAIVPPLSEKETPDWLRPIWQAAERELARADWWIVCGYSLPDYDSAIREMLARSAGERPLTVLILAPSSGTLRDRYARVAPRAEIYSLAGLPAGIRQLHDVVTRVLPPTHGRATEPA